MSFSIFFFHMFFEIALILASKKRTYFLEARIFQFKTFFLFFWRESGKEEKKGQFLPNSKTIYFSLLFSTFFHLNFFLSFFIFLIFLILLMIVFFICFSPVFHFSDPSLGWLGWLGWPGKLLWMKQKVPFLVLKKALRRAGFFYALRINLVDLEKCCKMRLRSLS